MAIERILVLEDNDGVRRLLEDVLRSHRYDVETAKCLADARKLLAKDPFDLMFTDLRLPDGEGIEILKELEPRADKPINVVMTGYATVQSAVECMRHGAFDYLTKPFDRDQIEMVLQKCDSFNHLLKVNLYLSHGANEETEAALLGRSPAMEQLRLLIRKVARTEATVLIQGESGVGKELVARALYSESPRARAPFIKVNCAAIPENLIESEFFGHEKGSFTGALTKREGRFELAHGGTILLDEVSEISPQVQAKLLRVLQEREFERVGGSRTIKVDIRTIATTNRNLQESIDRNEFRQDLYFRLNVVPIYVPPLRERQEDIPFLAEKFMKRFARKHGIHINGLSPHCLATLQNHTWPGNVRELQNVIERGVILCNGGDSLEPSHLGINEHVPVIDTMSHPIECKTLPMQVPVPPSPVSALLTPPQPKVASEFPTIDEIEKRHILTALDRCHNNRTHAARMLGISIRTLRNKLNEYSEKNRASSVSTAVDQPFASEPC